MSTIVKACLYLKALNDEGYFSDLVLAAEARIKGIQPCTCDTRCRDLTEEEKEGLTKRVNECLKIRREERKKHADEVGLTIEDMCQHSAKYLKEIQGMKIDTIGVANLSITHDLSDYISLYEEAVFGLGVDFFHRPAIEYFEERYVLVKDDPDLKLLREKYQKIIYDLEND